MSQAPIELCDTFFTREIMTDPVLAADGFTYNRPEITLWLDSNNTSPHTRQPLDNKTLLPNMYASSSTTTTTTTTSSSSSSAAAAAAQIQNIEATIVAHSVNIINAE
jgi:BRCT domain type II-containing protein